MPPGSAYRARRRAPPRRPSAPRAPRRWRARARCPARAVARSTPGRSARRLALGPPGDPGPVVGDDEARAAVLGLRLDGDRAPGGVWRSAFSIRLSTTCARSPGSAKTSACSTRPASTVFSASPAGACHRSTAASPPRRGRRSSPRAARRRARKCEEVVHERLEAVELLLGFAAFSPAGPAFGSDRLQPQLDPGQRRPELMRRVRDEVALGAHARAERVGHAVEGNARAPQLGRARRSRRARRGRHRRAPPRCRQPPERPRTVVARIQASTKAPRTTASPIAASRSQLVCTRSTTDSREAEAHRATTSPWSTTGTVTRGSSSPAVSLKAPRSRRALPEGDPELRPLRRANWIRAPPRPTLSASRSRRSFVTTIRSSRSSAASSTAVVSAACRVAPLWFAAATSSEIRAARSAALPSTSAWNSTSPRARC